MVDDFDMALEQHDAALLKRHISKPVFYTEWIAGDVFTRPFRSSCRVAAI
jgi:hypothetical protein